MFLATQILLGRHIHCITVDLEREGEKRAVFIMPVSFLLEEFPDDALDQILKTTPSGKTQYFTKLAKQFYDIPEDSDEFTDIVESYISSFYVEKMYRSNRFFNEKFTPIYTQTGLIRNVWSDLFFTNDDLITH